MHSIKSGRMVDSVVAGALLALVGLAPTVPIEAQESFTFQRIYEKYQQPRTDAGFGVSVGLAPFDPDAARAIVDEIAPPDDDDHVRTRQICLSPNCQSFDTGLGTLASFTAVAFSGELGLVARRDETSRAIYFHQLGVGVVAIGDLIAGPPIAALAAAGDSLVYGTPDNLAGAGSVHFCTMTISEPEPLDCSGHFNGAPGERLGTSVALRSDGLVAAVGAPGAAENGEVQIYVRGTFGQWSKIQTVEPPTSFYDFQSDAHFGTSVALSGHWLAVGAPNADRIGLPTMDVGHVLLYDTSILYVYVRLYQGTVPTGQLGTSVSMADAGDGLTLVAGVPFGTGNSETPGSIGSGQAEVFFLQGDDEWVRGPVLFDPDGRVLDQFGTSVSTNGRHVIAGAPAADYPATGTSMSTDSGVAVLFDWAGPKVFSDGFESGLVPWSVVSP